MQAGRLRTRFTLEEPVRTPDAGGGATIDWTPLSCLWGAIKPLSRRERSGAGGRLSEVTHDITIRHRDGVLPEMRLVHEARVFHILAVLDDEGGRQLVCHCREEVRA